MKIYRKLVRDNVPAIIQAEGKTCIMHIMDDDEYKKELLRKVVEEAHEMVGAADSTEELLKELSDLEEALDCVRIAFNLDREEAARVKEERKQIRGSFIKKIYMESAT